MEEKEKKLLGNRIEGTKKDRFVPLAMVTDPNPKQTTGPFKNEQVK